MKELNKIQIEILRKFMYNDKLKYNEIWDKNICSSSNFDYHLKILINDDILIKKDDFYILTSEGTSYVTSIDGVSIKNKKKPVVCSFVLAKNNEGKILFSIRKKQPYFDHLNIPGGKNEYGEFSNETALREFEEETGLSCDIKLMMINEKITFNLNEDKVEHQIIGYFYLGTNIKGKLIENTREGNNIWIKPEELKNFKRFPDLDFIVPFLIDENNFVKNKIKIAKVKRFRKNNEFVDIEIEELN